MGTNNVVNGRTEEIFVKFNESHWKLIILGLLPWYDVDSCILSKMLGINRRLKTHYREEDSVFSIYLCDQFSHDRSLYARDGLHLNGIGKTCLGRVSDKNRSFF